MITKVVAVTEVDFVYGITFRKRNIVPLEHANCTNTAAGAHM